MQRILLPERKRKIWPDMVRAFFVWKTADQRADDLGDTRRKAVSMWRHVLYTVQDNRKKEKDRCKV